MNPQVTTTTDPQGNVTIRTTSTTTQVITIAGLQTQSAELQTQITNLQTQKSSLDALILTAQQQLGH